MNDTTPAAVKKPRDLRLDVARGLSMFFILAAHLRGDWLYHVIPARFGLSDAADMFVFISGYAAAIAFGGTFAHFGWIAGLARTAFRCAQLYIAHITIAMFTALIGAASYMMFHDQQAINDVFMRLLFDEPARGLVGLFTLTYLPTYLDILPMYMVVLAMIPAVMLLQRLHYAAVAAASLLLWLAANHLGWNFISDPVTGDDWALNPFAWQAIFFLGFAFSRGWIRVKLGDPRLLAPAVAMLVIGFLLSDNGPHWLAPVAVAADLIRPYLSKMDLDPIRVVHFLSLAYVALSLLKGREAILHHRALRPFLVCGQQALTTFMSTIILAGLGSVAFARFGTGLGTQLAVNLIAFPAVLVVAYSARWMKAAPWKKPKAPAHAVVAQPTTAPVPHAPPSLASDIRTAHAP